MSNIRQAGGKIHFSQIMPEKSKIGDKSSSKEWRKIKEDAKQSAISICNRNPGIKTKVDEIAVRLQKRINRDNLTHDKMTEYSSELIKAGLNLSDTAELLKNILIMARHEGSGAEAPNTKINWFGSTNKTKAISDFIKGRGNDQNNKFQKSSENELITPLVHSLVHTYVANAGHGLTLSENLEENNPNPNKKLNSLNETQINSQYEKAFEYISTLDESSKSEYPNDQAHVLNSAYYSNATKSTLQNRMAQFKKTCTPNVQELCKDIKDVDSRGDNTLDEIKEEQQYRSVKHYDKKSIFLSSSDNEAKNEIKNINSAIRRLEMEFNVTSENNVGNISDKKSQNSRITRRLNKTMVDQPKSNPLTNAQDKLKSTKQKAIDKLNQNFIQLKKEQDEFKLLMSNPQTTNKEKIDKFTSIYKGAINWRVELNPKFQTKKEVKDEGFYTIFTRYFNQPHVKNLISDMSELSLILDEKIMEKANRDAASYIFNPHDTLAQERFLTKDSAKNKQLIEHYRILGEQILNEQELRLKKRLEELQL